MADVREESRLSFVQIDKLFRSVRCIECRCYLHFDEVDEIEVLVVEASSRRYSADDYTEEFLGGGA